MPGAQYDQHNFYETSWVDPTRLPTDGPVIYDELPRHCTDQSAHLPETLGDRHPLKTRRDIASRHNFDEPPNSYDCIFSLPSLTPTDTISPKMDSPTVVTLKQAFLESTTRQLAQSVAPSRTWIRKNDVKGGGYGVNAAAATGGNAEDIRKRIPPKIVDEVLIRINQLLLLHARHIHTPAAIRHVAEQLDQLYQTADDKVVAVPGEGSSDSLERGMDYSMALGIHLYVPVLYGHANRQLQNRPFLNCQRPGMICKRSKRYRSSLTNILNKYHSCKL